MKASGAEHRDTRTRRQAEPGKISLYPTQELKRRAMSWAVTLRVNPKVIRVREMRRKWGSCSSAGTVTLASDLVERDGRFQDYVIVHELLHLKYRDHGKQFKAMMTALVPTWRHLEQQSQHATESAGQGRREMEA